MQPSRPLKVVLIGDGDAGKTSLRSRYLTNDYQPCYRATIGADFVSRTIEVTIPTPCEGTVTARSARRRAGSDARGVRDGGNNDDDDDDDACSSVLEEAANLAAASTSKDLSTVKVTLSIWDTAGQERFRSLGSAFYRGADAVIIAFDVSKRGALQRTLSWYKDFCSMSDVGLSDDHDAGISAGRAMGKQSRKAREARERFCWVGVGCKGDLFANLQHSSQSRKEDDPWLGTSWIEARQWFDELVPRFLPPEENERNPFEQVRHQSAASSQAPTPAKPFAIKNDIPARPEDVLSRPSPSNKAHAGHVHDSNESSGEGHARHPDAGVPPGEAPSPGAKLALRKQPSLLLNGSKNKGVQPIDPMSHQDPPSSASEASLNRRIGERGRYDSTTSQSGNSIYYSIRGSSTVMSQSPAMHSDLSIASSSDAPTTIEAGAKDRSHQRNGSLTGRTEGDARAHRKRNSLSELYLPDSHEIDSRHRRLSRPNLQTIKSGESSDVTTLFANQEDGDGQGSTAREERHEKDTDDEPRSTSVPVVPSGDPIPFPTEEEENDNEYEQRMRARRRKRLSRVSAKRHSVVDLATTQSDDAASKIEADEVTEIAELVKADREEQVTPYILPNECESNDYDLPTSAENVDNRRMTLLSARPSSTSSTIRAADEDVEDIEPRDSSAERNGQRQPNSEDGLDLFEDRIEQGFRLFYTSAKTGTSIDDVFQHIARRVAIRWTYEEWEENQRREAWGYGPEGEVRTAPPTDEDLQRERVRRAIKISQGKSTGGCCS